MTQAKPSRFQRIMLVWEDRLIRHPWWVILVFLVSAYATVRYTMDHLKVDTDTADMISLEVPFQKNRLMLEKAFPQDIGTALLVVEGPTPEETTLAVDRLQANLTADVSHFREVYVPDGGDFFAREGLLYASLEDLEKLTRDLSSAQPFIGRLFTDNSLQGLLSLTADALKDQEKGDSSVELAPLLKALHQALDANVKNLPFRLSWRQLMMPDAKGFGITQRFILVKPVLNYQEVMPAETAILALNETLSKTLQGDLQNVKVRKTGEVILEQEEMETISNGVSVASLASLVLVCLTLWVAYRSFKLVIATFVSLSLGLIFSLGFATVAIGQLNLISIGFAVLFIGMGDAYSSHFCLRYRELLLEGKTQKEALQITLSSTGSALVLSAVTAAVGLFAFIPTSYQGVAELGIIAGASMFIALLTTFTVLPALMKIMPIHPKKGKGETTSNAPHWSNWPLRKASSIRIATGILTFVAIALTFKVQVDFNPVNLRDPNTESVSTFKSLLLSEETSPMTLSSVASNEDALRRLDAAYRKLSTVKKTMSLETLIPSDQMEKQALISDMALVMGEELERFPEPRLDVDPKTLLAFEKAIDRGLEHEPENPELLALKQDLVAQRMLLEKETVETTALRLKALSKSLLEPLPPVIRSLGKSLSPEIITRESLPKDLLARWVSPEGLYRLQVFPKENLDELQNLRRFIQDAQTVDPNVTDLPVTYLESMNEVIGAFQEAFGIAFVATTVILLLVFRNLEIPSWCCCHSFWPPFLPRQPPFFLACPLILPTSSLSPSFLDWGWTAAFTLPIAFTSSIRKAGIFSIPAKPKGFSLVR